MIELDISAGVLDAAYLRQWVIFSAATTASEVILTGQGSDPFDPFYGMIDLGGVLGRRLLSANGGGGFPNFPGPQKLASTGQGGTTFRNIPFVVLGGNNAPAVQLHKIRFEASSDAPAVYVHDNVRTQARSHHRPITKTIIELSTPACTPSARIPVRTHAP